MPEHLRVRHRRPVAGTVRHRADGDAQALLPLDLGDPTRQARTGRVVENHLHRGRYHTRRVTVPDAGTAGGTVVDAAKQGIPRVT